MVQVVVASDALSTIRTTLGHRMIRLHCIRRGSALFEVAALFLVLLVLFVSPGLACAKGYDGLVAMLLEPDPSVQDKGKEMLASAIKKNLLRMEPEQYTEDTFLFGHFVNRETADLAVGISIPPGGGHLVILSQKRGQYIPAGPVIGTGLIQDIKSVRLFPGSLDQLILNTYGQGSNVHQWGEDIYRWDGRAMREIWKWVRKSVESSWLVEPNGETTGKVTRSQISINDSANGMATEIVTSSEVDEGIFSDEKGREWEFKKVTSHHETRAVHRWDESLYFYVAKYGRILPSKITVYCTRGKGPGKKSETLHAGMKVGILEIPGTALSLGETYHAVIGKESFCEIPKTAVKVDE